MAHEPYAELANAIIVLATRDYKKALKDITQNKHTEAAQSTITEVEQFFNSTWFRILTGANPEYIINQITRSQL